MSRGHTASKGEAGIGTQVLLASKRILTCSPAGVVVLKTDMKWALCDLRAGWCVQSLSLVLVPPLTGWGCWARA